MEKQKMHGRSGSNREMQNSALQKGCGGLGEGAEEIYQKAAWSVLARRLDWSGLL